MPADFFTQLKVMALHMDTFNLYSFALGVACDPAVGRKAPPIALPAHHMDQQRFWIESPEARQSRMVPESHVHPHLGAIEKSAHADGVFTCKLLLDPRVETYLTEHCAQGHMVFPAAGQIELVTAVARHVFDEGVAVEGRHELVHEKLAVTTYNI